MSNEIKSASRNSELAARLRELAQDDRLNRFEQQYFAGEASRLEAAVSEQRERMIQHRVAPVCDEHGDKGGGARSGCPYCAIISLNAALSKIDYMCGEPNEMELSAFDVYYNEDAVVEHVRKRLSERDGGA